MTSTTHAGIIPLGSFRTSYKNLYFRCAAVNLHVLRSRLLCESRSLLKNAPCSLHLKITTQDLKPYFQAFPPNLNNVRKYVRGKEQSGSAGAWRAKPSTARRGGTSAMHRLCPLLLLPNWGISPFPHKKHSNDN